MPSEDNVFSNVGRIVAFVITPLLLPTAAVVANWLQDVGGLNLTGPELIGYIATIIAGVALSVYKWLANRGAWETDVLYTQRLTAESNKPVDDALDSEDPDTGLAEDLAIPVRPISGANLPEEGGE